MFLRRSYIDISKTTIQNAFQGLDKTCPLVKALWRDAKHFTTASYQGKSDQTDKHVPSVSTAIPTN